MKYAMTFIAETEEEIREMLHKAELAKTTGNNFPYTVSGYLPSERIDEIIIACMNTLSLGGTSASFTFHSNARDCQQARNDLFKLKV